MIFRSEGALNKVHKVFAVKLGAAGVMEGVGGAVR